MTTTRGWITAMALAAATTACKKDRGEPPAPAPIIKTEPAAEAQLIAAPQAPDVGAMAAKGDALPVASVKGPAVSPVVTSSITFVVPKDSGWWGELAFPCYAAGATLSSGAAGSPGAPFAKLSPTVPDAMAAGDIDLDHDLTAIGGFACGDSPCLYVAARLKSPDKMKDVLASLLPGTKQQDLGGGHYTLETPGMTGTRTIHVRVVPVKWTGGTAPSDPWARDQAATTHVVFIGGVDGKNTDVDPLTALADPTAAAAKVKDTESVISDAHGRCIIGTAGASDFKKGFKLDHARFVVAAPTGNGDPLTRLLGSTRTLDAEIELTLTPPPKDSNVKKWVKEGKAWVGEIAAPIRAQFASQGPMVDVMIEMFALIGERGFKPVIKGKALTLSWRTDRVPQSDLDALETRFQSVLGTP